MLTTKPCMDYLRFSGVLVIWKIVWDSRSNVNNSVFSRSFFELREVALRRRKMFGSGLGYSYPEF